MPSHSSPTTSDIVLGAETSDKDEEIRPPAKPEPIPIEALEGCWFGLYLSFQMPAEVSLICVQDDDNYKKTTMAVPCCCASDDIVYKRECDSRFVTGNKSERPNGEDKTYNFDVHNVETTYWITNCDEEHIPFCATRVFPLPCF